MAKSSKRKAKQRAKRVEKRAERKTSSISVKEEFLKRLAMERYKRQQGYSPDYFLDN